MSGNGGEEALPAKHCAIDIHSVEILPLNFKFTSFIFLTCITTWQNSSANPSILSLLEGLLNFQIFPEGEISLDKVFHLVFFFYLPYMSIQKYYYLL